MPINAHASEIKHQQARIGCGVWVLTYFCPRSVCGMLLYAQTFIDKEN